MPRFLATALFTAVAAAPLVHAQPATSGMISGTVHNAATGDALTHAQISVVGTPIVTATDEGGHYVLTGLPAGVHTLRVSFAGLDAKEISVNLAAGQHAVADVLLTNAALYGANSGGRTVKLDQYVVQSSRETNASAIAVNEQRYAANIKSVVAADEFGPLVDQNPGELLKYLPGMDVEYFANNIVGVSVRGMGSNNTEVSFDGMPVASMNAEGVGRGMEVQYASVADVGRAEIRYVRMPEDSANAIGGSVNFIRRSAFEASRRRIDYQMLFKADGEKLTLDRMDGPKDRLVPRWRPNWSIDWVEPVTKNFGFALSLGQNDTLVNTHWSLPGWNLGSSTNDAAAEAARAAGQPVPHVPSLYNPAMNNPLNHNAPKQQGKDFASVRLDWRPVPTLTLGWSLSGVKGWVQNADDIRYRWNAAATGKGDVARYNDQTMSLGRVGGGAIYHDNPLWRDVYSPTVSTAFDSRWRHGDWEASLNASLSESRYNYSDMADGFFNSTSVSNVSGLPNIAQTGVGAGTANPISLTIDYRDIGYWGPKTIQAWTTATGKSSSNMADYNVPVDWASNAVTRIGGARSRPGRSKEIVGATRAYLQRYFATRNPIIAKLGLDWYDTYRSRRYDSLAWQFVGADGIPGTADDSSSLIAAVNLHARPDSEYDYPGSERISMTRLYKLYQDHPTWFKFDDARSARLGLTQNPAYNLQERTTAPYFEIDSRFFHNRLRVEGGARYERTTDTTHGLLNTQNDAYLKYANGQVVHQNDLDAGGSALVTKSGSDYVLVNGPAVLPAKVGGNPVYLPGVTQGSLAETRLVYHDLGATGHSVTSGLYPSLNLDYSIAQNLIFQFGYARTEAKLDYSSVLIPGTSISDSLVTSGVGAGALGLITVHNTDLKPWTGDNFDARLAYYTKSGGQVNFALFTKRIKDVIVQNDTPPLASADIAAINQQFPDLNLGAEAEGYSLRTTYNAGNGSIDGAEFVLQQQLDNWVPHWARGFTIIGSATYLNRRGPNSNALGTNRAWLGKLNVMYRTRRLFARVGYTYNGEQINNPNITNNGYHGEQVTDAQNLFDATVSYAITRWARLFIAGSDVTDERRAREDRYAGRPLWGSMGSSNTFGVTYTAGVTGRF